MKQFNLEEAKAGKPVCTRDGHSVRIICFNKKSSSYPIIALIDYNYVELETSYTNEGRYYFSDEKSCNDLFMVDEKHEGWINIYNMESSEPCLGNRIYATKEEAQKVAAPNVVDTIKIEWED